MISRPPAPFRAKGTLAVLLVSLCVLVACVAGPRPAPPSANEDSRFSGVVGATQDAGLSDASSAPDASMNTGDPAPDLNYIDSDNSRADDTLLEPPAVNWWDILPHTPPLVPTPSIDAGMPDGSGAAPCSRAAGAPNTCAY